MSSSEAVILGVDPGTAITGVGVVSFSGRGDDISSLYFGCIQTAKNLSRENRLKVVFSDLNRIIEAYHPDGMAVEELFFNKNSKTVISVGEARGVVLLAAALHQLPVWEYTPLQVKQSVVGYGRAKKEQVIYMVKQILKIEQELRPDDVADALAVAICHALCWRR
ncbi:MAG: crossover junction endodeoxyribonuclease RuvC [Candidatus Atribacteria bacterium]|nr:crossover junction endodeoxyribonuclease RuvC [Candidatus Atribacteria bacterium]